MVMIDRKGGGEIVHVVRREKRGKECNVCKCRKLVLRGVVRRHVDDRVDVRL